MNNSYDFVSHCLLNSSVSKETHQFSKAQRFRGSKPSQCQQYSYDLSKSMMVSTLVPKNSILPLDSRFKSSASPSPSPNHYHHHSFIDLNRSVERGSSFGKSPKLVSRNKNYLFPAPGSHNPIYNPEKKLSYTMRPKTYKPDTRTKVGPGQYNIDSYYTTSKPQISSKFSNTKKTVLGTASRFKVKEFDTVSPGPFANYRAKTELHEQPNYSFGHHSKEPSYIKKNTVPGPGSYNKFSEFSELKGKYSQTQSSRYLPSH